jgi:hypothetical protein
VTLPRRLSDWPAEALEEFRERAALVWEGDRASTEADWPAAKAAAERIVRRRWAGIAPTR